MSHSQASSTQLAFIVTWSIKRTQKGDKKVFRLTRDAPKSTVRRNWKPGPKTLLQLLRLSVMPKTYLTTVLCSCCGGGALFKTPKALSFSNRSAEWNLARLQFVNYTHRLTELDFWCDVILSKWRPWRHFMLRAYYVIGALYIYAA